MKTPHLTGPLGSIEGDISCGLSFAWQIVLANLSGVNDVHILNICPEEWTIDPGPGPGRIGMNSDVKNETAMEVAALSASMTAMKKFQQPMVEYLLSGLDENDKWVRVMAAEMLGTIGDSRSAEYLKPLLAARDKDLRIVAAKSLAMIRSPRVGLALSQADNCENCMIRLVADEALERLKLGKETACHQ
jgi:hypothetical protein